MAEPFLLLVPSNTAVRQTAFCPGSKLSKASQGCWNTVHTGGPGVTHLPAQQDNHLGSGVHNQLDTLKPSQINKRKVFKECSHALKTKPALPHPRALLPHPSLLQLASIPKSLKMASHLLALGSSDTLSGTLTLPDNPKKPFSCLSLVL